ncbi:MAG TPA: cytochrome c oxidase subunit II [Thermoleophilaceae bacterium]
MVDTGHEYHHLFSIYVPIAVGVWLAIALATGYGLLRYRRRPGRVPSGRHEAQVPELTYAALLVGVAAMLLYFTFTTESKVDALPRKPGLVLHVTAGQWNWRFNYPNGASVVSSSLHQRVMQVPTNTVILVKLHSVDVVHSLWIPERRIKKDAFPGADNELKLTFPKAGTFSGACAEFCGLHHAEMRFGVKAVPRPQFDAWLRVQAGASG